ncbi:MAG TPA: alpha/beta hydrolase [Candidatus Acidoferrales bacterium]|nr:alpha/beta hydrolase [Candidatus Acidoferrales bacterium]
MSEPRDKYIDARGLRLHYLEWGEPSGKPLILVHGFLDQAPSWNPFVAALQDLINQPLWIVAPDCRGHGDSGWVGAGGYYHFPDYVLDLDHVVQALKCQTVMLIGHSMGGTISFLYTGAFPQRVHKLVLIEGIGPPGMSFSDAPTRMEKWITEVNQRGRKHFRQYSSVEAGAEQLRQTNPRLDPQLALQLARSGMKRSVAGKWLWKFDPLHRTAAPQPFYTAQAIEFLRRIACPVLIVDGAESHQTRRQDRNERWEAIKNRKQAVIENAGHMVHQDNPKALAEVIAQFLY